MKNQVVTINSTVLVQMNSMNREPQWGRILDARTGEILHIGRPSYIRRIARERYSTQVKK